MDLTEIISSNLEVDYGIIVIDFGSMCGFYIFVFTGHVLS